MLKRALELATERVALALKHRGGAAEELQSAVAEQRRIERDLSLAKNEETASVVDWRPQWDAGAPLPHVISSGLRTFLIYIVSEPDPSWDGTYANVVDPASETAEPLAIVEFKGCYAHKFGGPNDEVIEGHPLNGHGLTAYRAHKVLNSKWLASERAINGVHAAFRPRTWDEIQHYLLFFHDDCFECLTRSYRVELALCSFREAIALVSTRLLDA